jgi:peptidoglycan/LPS O-acetylase OafA/YrhL
LAFVLIGGAWEKFAAGDSWDKLTGVFLLGMDWRVAFVAYPSTHFEAGIFGLYQAWTLGAELTFYLLAPFLMRSWKIGAALLIASFGLRAFFVARFGTELQLTWTYLFIGSTFGFFMLGHLICLAGRRFPVLAGPRLGVLLLVASLLAMTFGGSYVSFDGRRFWLSVLLFTLALPGLFEATKSVRWMNLIGDLSYPLYLVHMGVLVLFGAWLVKVALPIDTMGPLPAAYISIAAFTGASILAALAVHKLVEIPRLGQ